MIAFEVEDYEGPDNDKILKLGGGSQHPRSPKSNSPISGLVKFSINCDKNENIDLLAPLNTVRRNGSSPAIKKQK